MGLVVTSLQSKFWKTFVRHGVRNMVESDAGRRTSLVKMTGGSLFLVDAIETDCDCLLLRLERPECQLHGTCHGVLRVQQEPHVGL